MHGQMESYLIYLAFAARQSMASKFPARIRPLEQWCAEQSIDPVAATPEQLAEFMAWLREEYRKDDGGQPSSTTLRHVVNAAAGWYRWLKASYRRDDDPGEGVLVWSSKPKAPPKPSPFGDHGLHEAMQAYLDHIRLRGRDRTADCVGLSLRQFNGWCVEQHVDPVRLTRDQAESYLVWLTGIYRSPDGQPLARSTASTRIANLKSWYDWLEIHGRIIANPAAKLHVRVPKSRVVVHQPLNLQESMALLQTAAAVVEAADEGTVGWARHYRDLVAIALGLASGRRIAGLAELRVDQLDLERSELRVEREKGRTGRVLPIADWGTSVAQAYIEQARPLLVLGDAVPWLFPGNDGTGHITPSRLDEMLGQMVSQTIGLNPDLDELPAKTITWHSLRVSFATLLFSNGCPIRSVNELMLHACLSTTARYTPIPIEDMHRVWRSAHPRP